jgi:hypothetical protein
MFQMILVTGGILGKIESSIRILRDIPNARVIFCKAGSSVCREACLGIFKKECDYSLHYFLSDATKFFLILSILFVYDITQAKRSKAVQ